MFGNNMFATNEYGSDKILNLGYDVDNVVEELLVFEPRGRVDGDDGSPY